MSNKNNDQQQHVKNAISIYWFRNALRFHDNPSFKKACDESCTLIPLYVIDPTEPFSQTHGHRAGYRRANFILESIQEVDHKLQLLTTTNQAVTTAATKKQQVLAQQVDAKSRMIVILGKPEEIIPKVITALNVTAMYYEQEAAEPIRKVDQRVIEALKNGTTATTTSTSTKHQTSNQMKCQIYGFPTHTLIPMEVYLSKCKGNVAPASYGAFTKLFYQLRIADEVPDIVSVPSLPPNTINTLREMQMNVLNLDESTTIPTILQEQLGYTNQQQVLLRTRTKGGIDFNGGETAALTLLQYMMNRTQWVATFEKPKTSPNALTVDTTGLSPYVKHGCLSPRRFYNELSKVYAKYNTKNISKPPVSLHGQLLWREYNYLTGYSTPNFDKMINNPIARQIPWDDDPELLHAWEHSQTGYPFIDAIMTQLRETGWIHHLARHAVACFLTRGDLWQSWEHGAKVFETYLLDADWSINNFNWQWLSCTAHFYQYFRCYSPIAFGKKTDPNGNYIRKWLPLFKDVPAKYIYEPWDAPIEIQRKCGVIVGETYPYPIVDHKVVSKDNMNRMNQAYEAQKHGQPIPERPSIRQVSTLGQQVQHKKKKTKTTISNESTPTGAAAAKKRKL